MAKIIDIIENNRFIYLLFSIFFFVFISITLVLVVDVTFPRILLVTITTILFSLYNRVIGIIVGALSMLLLAISFNRLGSDVFALSMRQIMTVGMFINAIVSYTIGTLKLYYLKNKNILRIVEKSKEKYRKVVDNMKEGMIILDEKGTVIFINQSASGILGIPVENIGFNILDIIDNENIPLLKKELTTQNSGRTAEYKIEYKHPVLGPRIISVAATPYIHNDEEESGSLGFLLDITEINEINARVEALKKRNEYLLSEISHRIGNNLAGIQAYINLYFSDDMINTSDGLEKVDDIIQTMTYLNYEFFKNFERKIVNMKNYLNYISVDLSDKYSIPSGNLKLGLHDKEQHIDKALPFGMLFTIILTNIYIETQDQVEKPKIEITMADKLNKTEVTICISEKNIFKKIGKDRLNREQEIIEALLQQFDGSMDIDHVRANCISFLL